MSQDSQNHNLNCRDSGLTPPSPTRAIKRYNFGSLRPAMWTLEDLPDIAKYRLYTEVSQIQICIGFAAAWRRMRILI
jgi:hypothetical protein